MSNLFTSIRQRSILILRKRTRNKIRRIQKIGNRLIISGRPLKIRTGWYFQTFNFFNIIIRFSYLLIIIINHLQKTSIISIIICRHNSLR